MLSSAESGEQCGQPVGARLGTALVVLGTMIGLELAVAVVVNPLIRRQGEAVEINARSRGAGLLGRVMPFWYVASLGLVGAAAVSAWGSGVGPMLISALALLVVAIALTILVLVPINNRVATWDSGVLPADWRAQLGRWDRGHGVRVALIFLAFVLCVVAAVQ